MILEVRAEEEDVHFDQEAMDLLVQISQDCSLRYAIQLITASNLIAEGRNRKKVELVDLRKAYLMFWDVKRAVQFL